MQIIFDHKHGTRAKNYFLRLYTINFIVLLTVQSRAVNLLV
jgi:hypothetical protein